MQVDLVKYMQVDLVKHMQVDMFEFQQVTACWNADKRLDSLKIP